MRRHRKRHESTPLSLALLANQRYLNRCKLHLLRKKEFLVSEITIPKIGLILGTNRPRRIGGTIAEWTQNHLTSPAFETELIDLEKVGLPFLDEPDIPAHGHYTQAHTQVWSATIQQYAGFVLLFPQYNWGYPAVLKNALDYLYAEWAHKPGGDHCLRQPRRHAGPIGDALRDQRAAHDPAGGESGIDHE
ncbi:NAD(P)H-dependent oxidoreductase [Schleiferilactobacillus harbinensis]|uniref:NAD(P)H-dependent oxidoreductase n=2 Tax=Schleiferilactobacillus harbinensis TaxID=304207 RepID=A0ABU7T3H7_9LACO